MLLSDYLKTRGQISVTTGAGIGNTSPADNKPAVNSEGRTFADELKSQLNSGKGVQFSNHAIKRIESRNISIEENNMLERLNKGIEIAAEKGSTDSLILVDSTAFLVSVKNNKVVTTMSQEDMKGNIFTNIDSTVII
ncbi:MAG: TIGR02530 family flagellar biosynthesis protein [Ruminiclostridium sp.]